MQYLLDEKQMRAVDLYNIEEIGIPSLVLMERAALEVAKEAERLCPEGGSVLLFCGMGNNGADGLAAARMLFLHGRRTEVLLVGKKERATRENQIQQGILEKLGVPVCTVDNFSEYDTLTGASPPARMGMRYELIVDALFGIGLSRPLDGSGAEAVSWINQRKKQGASVLSVDIPSGIQAGTGHVLGAAVRADVTVTFGYEKLGMVLYPGCEYAGRRLVADIGFAEPAELRGAVRGFLPGECGKLPCRPADGNKGTFGRVFLAAGSAGMCGAAYLGGKAAALGGAGLVQIGTAKENVPVLQTLLPEAIVTVIGEEYEKGVLGRAAVLVAGPGFSVKPYAEKILETLLRERKERELPCVLDADALNLLAKNPEWFDLLDGKTILTPHMGEMARLTGKSVGELKEAPIKAAEEFWKEHGVVCVLKDARTVAASEKGIYLNLSGNDGMATGGSGDVLSGLLGGLLSGGMDAADAAETGVYLHGLAGDAAAARLGRHAMMAGDILEAVGGILHDWE